VRAILGLPPRTSADPPFIVALRGLDDPIGLIVDSIADIYAIAAAEVESLPATWPAERAACFLGTARVPAGLMGLLNIDSVVRL
jgi:chemotaxis signal transduction protein